jgi:hypothetical protein
MLETLANTQSRRNIEAGLVAISLLPSVIYSLDKLRQGSEINLLEPVAGIAILSCFILVPALILTEVMGNMSKNYLESEKKEQNSKPQN